MATVKTVYTFDMALLLHITIALASVGYTTFVFFSPSTNKLHVSYGFIAATLLSGFYLVWANPAHMLQACMSGLLYIGIVTCGLAAAHHKLASEKSRIE